MMLAAIRALRDVFSGFSWGLLIKCAVYCTGLIVVLNSISWFVLNQLQVFTDSDADLVFDLFLGMGGIVLSWFLFPIMVPVVLSFLLEDVAEAVEKHHYAHLPKPFDQSAVTSAWAGVKLFGTMVLAHVIAIPLYLIPGVNIFVFYLITGYLIGREMFEIAALRHSRLAEVKALRKHYRTAIIGAGIVIALLLMVPFVNLAAPIFGVAMMVHFYHRVRETHPQMAIRSHSSEKG